MMAQAKSYIECGNLTRGSYGVEPIPVRGRLEWNEQGGCFFVPDPDGPAWACWDPDWGWIMWPEEDIIEDGR